jgi:exoribonuclease R
MPARQFSLRLQEPPALREGLRRLRSSLGIPGGYPQEALAEAEAAAASPVLPDRDLTDIPFVTLDPPGSTDLDQAFHLSRRANGYLLRYAIADVTAFVLPGGALDAETHARGQTFYAPTHRVGLHPPVLAEGAASLLPGQVRPALVWEIEFDSAGATTAMQVARAQVRNRRQWAYPEAQEALDAGSEDEQLVLLREVGLLRVQQEAARGGVSLPVPEQEVVTTGHSYSSLSSSRPSLPSNEPEQARLAAGASSVWELDFRALLPIETWNAQLSLATGMAAARIMLDGGVGILRTLPPARDSGLGKLRRTAAALGIRWPHSLDYPGFVRSLDPSQPRHAAMLNACTLLFRGAGYAAFDGELPAQAEHAAIAAPYAHCTAPLRRLVDRYAGEICVALCAGETVPDWVAAALPSLPGEMDDSNRRARKYERGIVDLVEAMVLAPRLGETFTGTVLEADPEDNDGIIQLIDPAVEAAIKGEGLTLGEQVQATLVAADLLTGAVRFATLAS